MPHIHWVALVNCQKRGCDIFFFHIAFFFVRDKTTLCVHPRMPAALVGEDGEVMACTYVSRSQRAAAAAASRSAADEECRE
jgi:hypothetical protein